MDRILILLRHCYLFLSFFLSFALAILIVSELTCHYDMIAVKMHIGGSGCFLLGWTRYLHI